MAKIPVSSILTDFRRMAQENWAYVAGGSSTGQVDCSGAFVWAFRQHGCSIYHGSNRIARTEVVGLTTIDKARVVPGMVAFKCRQPGLFTGYDLPDDYLMGGAHYNGDLGDYYHIGLVGDDTSQVLNAQSSKTGFVTSDIARGWTHVGYLTQVDYGADSGQASGGSGMPEGVTGGQSAGSGQPEGVEGGDRKAPFGTATVVASSGSTVNLRKKPDTHAALVERVPIGANVEVTGAASGGWYPVRWGKWAGWMMGEFLAISSTGEMVGGGAGAPGVQPQSPPSGNWAVTIYDLAESEAREIASLYPSATVFETVG